MQPNAVSDCGTPVVPVCKALQLCQQKAKLKVCSEYSVTVNAKLETHRNPMPHPDDLIRKLDVGYKIDLSVAYRQIELAQKAKIDFLLVVTEASGYKLGCHLGARLFPKNNEKVD